MGWARYPVRIPGTMTQDSCNANVHEVAARPCAWQAPFPQRDCALARQGSKSQSYIKTLPERSGSRTKLLGTYQFWYFETLNISTLVRRFQRHLRCFYLLHSRLMRNTTNGGTPLTLESVNHQSEPPIRMYSCLMSPSFVGPSTCHKISNCRASWISSLH